jgi:hypothetical protein
MGPIAYKLAFPANIKIHNVFHVSLLKKYVHDSNHVIDWNVIQVEPEGEFHLEPLCILDKKVTMLWNRAITRVKVQWKHFGPNEATWEMEDAMREAYPSLVFTIDIVAIKNTEDGVIPRGRGCNIPNFTLGIICN